MKVASLVCEGGCNPTREYLERRVEADSMKDDKGRVMPGPKVTMLRNLIHTLHDWKGRNAKGERWVCRVCNTERKYG